VYDFLFVIIELFSLALTVEALQGKTCQDSLLSGEGRLLGAKISGEWVVSGEYFLVSTKLDIFCYPKCKWHRAIRAVVLTQYRRVTDGQTDGQTDGIAVASTTLAKRRAVKEVQLHLTRTSTRLSNEPSTKVLCRP